MKRNTPNHPKTYALPDRLKHPRRRLFERELRHWTVYALVDPRDRRIRYVGLTCNPAKRLRAHCLYGTTSLQGWVDDLKSGGALPEMQRLLGFDGTWPEAAALELEWIRRMVAAGHDLLNSEWHR